MTKISKSVIDKIDEKHIKPIPKWQFVLLNVAMWALFVATILLGGIATSLVILKLFNTQWALAPRIGGNFFIVLPYIWFGLLALMIFIGSKIFEKTKKGYRRNHWTIAGISVLASITLGCIFYSTHAAQNVEETMQKHVPAYKELQQIREKVWHAPEEGLLPGRIVEASSESLIILNDLTGQTWEVDIEDARMARDVTLKVGMPVLATGEKTGDLEFKADAIRAHKNLPPPLEKAMKRGMEKPRERSL
ncbi:hypothetical protein ACFL3C_04305 [Patescibacteria group bacterium]